MVKTNKILLLSLLGIFLIGIVSAQCPLNPADYDQIIPINTDLRSDVNSGASSSIINIGLMTAGNYEVTLVAENGYNGREDTNPLTQQNEQYYVRFLRGNSQVVVTPSTPDLLDGVSYDSKNITATISIGNSGADSIQAVHSAFPSPGSPNSLTAVCVGIKKLEEPPACSDISIDKTEASKTGIEIRPRLDNVFGGWIGNALANLLERNHQIKYVVETEGIAENVKAVLKLDNLVLSESVVTINDSYQNVIEWNSTGFCGSHTLNLEVSREGECSSFDSASREIFVECENPPQEPVCGNNLAETGEECDDGNLINGDGCSASCQNENNNEDKKNHRAELLPFSECVPNWECSGWSECYQNTMTRTCKDTNFCEFPYNKPLESSLCAMDNVQIENKKNSNLWLTIAGIIFLIVLIFVLIILLR